jgi:hypothetical protein
MGGMEFEVVLLGIALFLALGTKTRALHRHGAVSDRCMRASFIPIVFTSMG